MVFVNERDDKMFLLDTEDLLGQRNNLMLFFHSGMSRNHVNTRVTYSVGRNGGRVNKALSHCQHTSIILYTILQEGGKEFIIDCSK